MKNSDILNNYTKLQNILPSMRALPARVSYALVRNTNTLRSIVEDIEKVRYDIVTRYGTQDEEDATKFMIAPENIEIAQKELTSLETTETHVDLVSLDIKDFDGIELTPAEMDALMFMLEED